MVGPASGFRIRGRAAPSLTGVRDVAELLDQIDVERFAIIAGALPLTEPGVCEELPAMDRFLTRTSLRAPWLAAQPALYGRLSARELGPAAGCCRGVSAWMRPRDELVNPSWPRRLASRIPNATLNIRDGGHFMAHLHHREIFGALRC